MNYTIEMLEAPLSDDPVLLDAELKELRAAQLNRAKFEPNPNASDEVNAANSRHHDHIEALMIRRQISIIAFLRKTGTTGPAKGGGKRAKKAGADFAALQARILGTAA